MFSSSEFGQFLLRQWEAVIGLALLAILVVTTVFFARKKLVKTPLLSTMSPMMIGLLVVLFLFAVGAVLLPLIEAVTPNLDRFLRFISIVVPIIITAIFSQHQLQHIYTQRERDRVRELTASPINSLINVMRGIDNLRESWQVVCSEHKMSESTQHAVTESFYALTRGTAAAVNSIIMVTPGEKNAPGWHDYQQAVQCPICAYELQPSIGPLRESVKVICPSCKKAIFVRRRSLDGGLTAAPWRDERQPRIVPSQASFALAPKPVSASLRNLTVICPKCSEHVAVEAPSHHREVNRGCPKCNSTFRLDTRTQQATILPGVTLVRLSSDNVTLGDERELRRIRCRCDNSIGAKATKSFEGGLWWNCWRCGAVIKDIDHILPAT